MAIEYVSGVYLVRVAVLGNPEKPSQLWIAAVPKEQAVEAVRKRLPPGCTAELSEQRVTKALAELMQLQTGEVCELSASK
jgi:hypothetical protein